MVHVSVLCISNAKVRNNKPADSLPITKVTFSFWSIAFFKLDFACLRKAPREFLEIAIVWYKSTFLMRASRRKEVGDRVACERWSMTSAGRLVITRAINSPLSVSSTTCSQEDLYLLEILQLVHSLQHQRWPQKDYALGTSPVSNGHLREAILYIPS